MRVSSACLCKSVLNVPRNALFLHPVKLAALFFAFATLHQTLIPLFSFALLALGLKMFFTYPCFFFSEIDTPA